MIITIQLINILWVLKLTLIKLSHFILLWSNILYFSQHKIQDIPKIQINLFFSLFKNLKIKILGDNLFECPKLNWLEVAEQYIDRILFQNFLYSIWWKIRLIYFLLYFLVLVCVWDYFFLLLFDHYFKNRFFTFNYNNNWILLILYGCRIQKRPKLWNTLFFYFQV